MAKDVVSFLSWAAEPEHDERKKTGIKAVIIFSTLMLMSLYVKRFKWNTIKNRKIRMSTSLSVDSSLSICSLHSPRRQDPPLDGRVSFSLELSTKPLLRE